MEASQSADLTFLYQLIPSAISIFLVLASTLTSSALGKRIRKTGYSAREKQVALDIANDWAARLGFHSAMLAALAGAVAVATDPFTGWLVVTAVILLAIVWFLMQQYLWGEQIGDLDKGGRFRPANVCSALLVVINLLIVFMFLLNHPGRRATLHELLL